MIKNIDGIANANGIRYIKKPYFSFSLFSFLSRLKKENKLKEKYGFLIYLIPFAFAIPSMFFINGYLAREFYASIIFIVVYAICYYVYNKI